MAFGFSEEPKAEEKLAPNMSLSEKQIWTWSKSIWKYVKHKFNSSGRTIPIQIVQDSCCSFHTSTRHLIIMKLRALFGIHMGWWTKHKLPELSELQLTSVKRICVKIRFTNLCFQQSSHLTLRTTHIKNFFFKKKKKEKAKLFQGKTCREKLMRDNYKSC